ncbi:MAG TPA: hypothetical protein DCE41_26070 [Cytophagales bacterium]|nr:hypothetical protein [Cytophagales bacterium]
MLQHISQQEHSTPATSLGSKGKSITQLMAGGGGHAGLDIDKDLKVLEDQYKKDQQKERSVKDLKDAKSFISDDKGFNRASARISKLESGKYKGTNARDASIKKQLDSGADRYKDLKNLKKVYDHDPETYEAFTIDTRAQLNAWWARTPQLPGMPQRSEYGDDQAGYDRDVKDFQKKHGFDEKLKRVELIESLASSIAGRDKVREEFNQYNSQRNQLLLKAYGKLTNASLSTQELLAFRDASKSDMGGLLKKNKERLSYDRTENPDRGRLAAAQKEAIRLLKEKTLEKLAGGKMGAEAEALVSTLLGPIPAKKDQKDPVKEAARRLAQAYLYDEGVKKHQQLTRENVILIIKYLNRSPSQMDKYYAGLMKERHKKYLSGLMSGGMKSGEYVGMMKGGIKPHQLKKEMKERGVRKERVNAFKEERRRLRDEKWKPQYNPDGTLKRHGAGLYLRAITREQQTFSPKYPGDFFEYWKTPNFQTLTDIRSQYRSGMNTNKLFNLPTGLDGSFQFNEANAYTLQQIQDIEANKKQVELDKKFPKAYPEAMISLGGSKKSPNYRTKGQIGLTKLLSPTKEENYTVFEQLTQAQKDKFAKEKRENPLLKALKAGGGERAKQYGLFTFGPALPYITDGLGKLWEKKYVKWPLLTGVTTLVVIDGIKHQKNPANALSLVNLFGQKFPILKDNRTYPLADGTMNRSWELGIRTDDNWYKDDNKARFAAANAYAANDRFDKAGQVHAQVYGNLGRVRKDIFGNQTSLSLGGTIGMHSQLPTGYGRRRGELDNIRLLFQDFGGFGDNTKYLDENPNPDGSQHYRFGVNAAWRRQDEQARNYLELKPYIDLFHTEGQSREADDPRKAIRDLSYGASLNFKYTFPRGRHLMGSSITGTASYKGGNITNYDPLWDSQKEGLKPVRSQFDGSLGYNMGPYNVKASIYADLQDLSNVKVTVEAGINILQFKNGEKIGVFGSLTGGNLKDTPPALLGVRITPGRKK